MLHSSFEQFFYPKWKYLTWLTCGYNRMVSHCHFACVKLRGEFGRKIIFLFGSRNRVIGPSRQSFVGVGQVSLLVGQANHDFCFKGKHKLCHWWDTGRRVGKSLPKLDFQNDHLKRSDPIKYFINFWNLSAFYLIFKAQEPVIWSLECTLFMFFLVKL